MIARARQISLEMIPDVSTWIKSAIRIGVGVTLIAVSGHVPRIGDWFQFAGKMFIVLAIIGFVGHAEGVFIAHAADKVRREWRRMLTRVWS